MRLLNFLIDKSLIWASSVSQFKMPKLFCSKNYLSVILIVITLSACAVAPTNHKEDVWFSQDKYAHFVLSGITSAVIAKAAKDDGQDNCEAAFIGFGITLSLGAAKESYDKRHKKTLYSFHDMSWNLLGSTIGSLAGSNCH